MKTYCWYASSGRGIQLYLTEDEAKEGNHVGDCAEDVKYLSNLPHIREQLNRIDPDILAEELSEYTDWDTKDHEENLQRLMWIACGDIQEFPEDYEYSNTEEDTQ
jgi:lauroyl/myristoyl acyltransferase